MKKLFIGAAAILFLTGTVLAQDKKAKEPTCKKGSACCKQPSKTASLRTKAVVKPVQPAKPAAKK
jgi:hypothetical protein